MACNGEEYSSTLVDVENLATIIALASDALASAAEGLAEAVKAISDASVMFDSDDSTNTLTGTTCPSGAPENSDSRNEVETNEGLLVDQSDLEGLPIHQAKSRFDRGILGTSTPVQSHSSDSNEVGVTRPQPGPASGQNLSGSHLPISRGERKFSEDHDISQSDQNNKLDAFSSPSMSGYFASPYDPRGVATNKPQAPPRAPISPPTLKSHSIIPSGRNYIDLDQESDGLAFIAFMALQANRIICLIPDHLLNSYPELLKSLTRAKIHRADTPEQLNRVVGSRVDFFAPTSYSIALTPSSKFMANAVSYGRMAPDCVLHWGEPLDVRQYFDRVLVPLPSTALTCVMVFGKQHLGGDVYGVHPYSNAVLNNCFGRNSSLQQLRQISSRLMVERTPAGLTEKRSTRSGLDPLPPQFEPLNATPPSIPRDRKEDMNFPPAGHYYIILDTVNDIDIIPMTAYIATVHNKVICHLPGDKVLTGYQWLLSLISDVNVIVPSPLAQGKQFKAMAGRLKSEKSGIMLRHAGSDWNAFWSKSLADCILFWGMPSDLMY
ncbi:unnamed protein product [Rhizoctonia solani]|uniref:Uncharacterized protein n=1 Tax=Rhizoctonia solani TaxID=456999 RepID=A0A8H3HCX0_9AGAM|nr:unnamed protein product [Rhizoctonia solani]